uniref:Uncharacterized protein n=1 Tax=viral metagenome TaxID=1070528 RepID=A0A6C0K2C9_9ZZZZ
MSDAAIMLELTIETLVGLMVLYVTVITYRLSPGGIIGIYILSAVVFSLIRRSMYISAEALGTSLETTSTIKTIYYGILLIVSLVGSYIIAMKRFTFLESTGIFVAGVVPAIIIDLLITMVWQPEPPLPPMQQYR